MHHLVKLYLRHVHPRKHNISIENTIKSGASLEVKFSYKEGVFSKRKSVSETIDVWEMLEFVFYNGDSFQ